MTEIISFQTRNENEKFEILKSQSFTKAENQNWRLKKKKSNKNERIETKKWNRKKSWKSTLEIKQ